MLLALLGLWHAVVQPLPGLLRLDEAVDDLRQTAFLRSEAHPDIVIVDVDEASLAQLGRWPWPRARLATLLDELFERQRVAAVGFDFLFAEPDTGGWPALQALAARDPLLASRLPEWQASLNQDAPLARALQGRPVVLGHYLSADRGGARSGQLPQPWLQPPAAGLQPRLPAWNGWGASLPALAQAAPRAGFFNAAPDADGVVRHVPAVAWVDGQLQASLALTLARTAAGDPPVRAVWSPAPGRPGLADLIALDWPAAPPPAGQAAALPSAGSVAAVRRLPLDERGALRVPYRGRGGPAGGSFRYVSAARLIAGELPARELAGRLVLVGSSAPGLADLRATPVNPAMPGVEVHAHLLAGLLDGDLPRGPGWAPGFEASLVLLSLLLSALAATRLAGRWAVLAAAGLGLALVLGNLLAYRQAALVLPVAVPLLLSALLFLGALSFSYVREWEGRRSLYRLFSSYLPPDRARQLARDPSEQLLSADNRELTVLFCDLRGFSGIAENLPPLALRDLLNQFLSTTTAIVHAHGGTLDKFIGDAVMAFWGAPEAQPDHARRAVQAALALVEGLGPLNAQLRERRLPEVGFGVGLATGVVCVGDLGSSARRAYTAVGDAVNLAARLEAATRATGLDILVTQATKQAVQAQADPPCAWLEVDDLPIRGRRQGVKVFTPLPFAALQLSSSKEMLRIWQLALEAAQQHHVQQARAHLARLQALLSVTPDPNTSEPTANGQARALMPASPAAWLAPLCARLSRQLDAATSSAPQPADPGASA